MEGWAMENNAWPMLVEKGYTDNKPQSHSLVAGVSNQPVNIK
jgi:hypothetical protein